MSKLAFSQKKHWGKKDKHENDLEGQSLKALLRTLDKASEIETCLNTFLQNSKHKSSPNGGIHVKVTQCFSRPSLSVVVRR